MDDYKSAAEEILHPRGQGEDDAMLDVQGTQGDSDENDEPLLDPTQASPGALHGIDIEGMIGHIHSASLNDHGAIGSRRKVPRGFIMQAAVSEERLKQEMDFAREKEEERRRKGLEPSISQCRSLKYGFNPSQVIRKHAISAAKDFPHMASTLSNAIHPLFAYERFYECPMEIYDVLRPALSLASQFLLHPACAKYFHTLAFGNREPCPDWKAGVDIMRIRNDVSWTADNAARFAQYLEVISGNLRITFDMINPREAVFGCCFISEGQIDRRRLPLDQYQRCILSYIDLHIDLYTTAKRLSLLKTNADPAMILRFNFFFAVNICHEVAHFLEISHNAPNPEVLMNDNIYSEAGIAWECKMFGGRVHPISARMDCAYGLATYDFPPTPNKADIYYTVSTEYVAHLQQQTTWDAMDHTHWRSLHIPRTGARGVGLCALNMTIWDDEATDKVVDSPSPVDGDDLPFRRTFDGRIVKSATLNTTSKPAAAQKPDPKEIYGSASVFKKYTRKRDPKQKKKAEKAAWVERMKIVMADVVCPKRGRARWERRKSI